MLLLDFAITIEQEKQTCQKVGRLTAVGMKWHEDRYRRGGFGGLLEGVGLFRGPGVRRLVKGYETPAVPIHSGLDQYH
jgi:hypothetical protein